MVIKFNVTDAHLRGQRVYPAMITIHTCMWIFLLHLLSWYL